MRNLTAATIYLWLDPTDRRKSFDPLALLVREPLQGDPQSGSWFVFRNKAGNRLKILAGQVNALQKQIEEDRYCVDVLDLSLSIQRALKSLDALVLEGHLRTHVQEMMTNGELDTAVQELLRIYRVPEKS